MRLPSKAFSCWTKPAEATTGTELVGRAWVAGVIVQLPGAVWLLGKVTMWSLNGVQRHLIRSFAGELQLSSLSLLSNGNFLASIASLVLRKS